MFIIEQRYGNDGYAFWYKLLETLGETEGHYLDMNDSVTFEYLRSKTRREDSFVTEILDLLSKIEAIDAELWGSRIVWCQHFVDGISDVYTRSRHTKPPARPDNYAAKPHVTDISTQINPQSKVKESKVKKRIKDYSSDSEEIRLAEFLFSKILEKSDKFKKPNFQAWAKSVDLMIRVDKRSPEDIQSLIEWCQGDPFWSKNILSTAKLREKFDQLWIKKQDVGGNVKMINSKYFGLIPADSVMK